MAATCCPLAKPIVTHDLLPLWLVIVVDADEFARSKIERLHQIAGDAAQILDPTAGVGGLASDDFNRLVRLGNGDDIEGRSAVTRCGFSD